MSIYGTGILKGLGVTLKHFVETFVDDIRYLGRRNNLEVFQQKQSLHNKGMVTVEYPEEKLAVPERFRFVPFLVTYNHDDPVYPDKDWCTSCGICAKVCPPQCIWIVRGTNPETGRPKPEPEQFFIDIDICMNCGYCAEYCPFDAIKMDHNYEMASYDRTSAHIHDKQKLSHEIRYWQTIAPTLAAEEEDARGGYDHTDVQKARKKAGLSASRPGPVSDKPEAPAPVVAAAPAAPVESAPVQPKAEAAPQATTTTDGKPIVRRRGAAGVAKAEASEAPAAAPQAPVSADTTPDGKPIVRRRGASSAPKTEASTVPAAEAPVAPAEAAPAPQANTSTETAAPTGDSDLPPGFVRRGKRIINLNADANVTRRSKE